jgi:hypothetical protein
MTPVLSLRTVFGILFFVHCRVHGFVRRHDKLASPIVGENKLIGSSGWWHPPPEETHGLLSGFATKFSLDPGQLISFKINSSIWQNFTISIYRLGYYQGTGARLLHNETITQTFIQPSCLFEHSTRLTDCDNWKISYSWRIPKGLVSGICVAKLSASDLASGKVYVGHYIPFIVRLPFNINTSPFASDILFKTADTTWVAYNKYGGWNIYRGNGSFTFDSRAFMASYNRPFTNRLPKLMGGQHQNFLFGTEFPALFWMEKVGYDMSYASSADIELYYRHKILGGRYHVLLSVGHDEYWSEEMRLAYEHARENGINLAFLSGNEIFWRIRWRRLYKEPEARDKGYSSFENGRYVILEHHVNLTDDKAVSLLAAKLHVDDEHHNRIVVCFKETIDNRPRFDSPELWTGTFIDPRFRPPVYIHSLTGQHFQVNGFRHDSITISPGDAKLRFWRNTGIANTSTDYTFDAGYLGYEWDVFRDDCALPLGIFTLSDTVVNATGFMMEKFGAAYKGSGYANHRMTIYRHVAKAAQPHHAPKTSIVFGAGTVQWVWGLSDWHDTDIFVPASNVIQQATVNMLADMNSVPMTLENAPNLKFSRPSHDIEPPQSYIKFPASLSTVSWTNISNHILNISGTAQDFGGGRVARILISVDGGVSWNTAVGRDSWYYAYELSGKNSKHCGNYSTNYIPNATHQERQTVSIISRSVDDSGWVESCDTTFHGGISGASVKRSRAASHHNHRFNLHSKCTIPSSSGVEGHASNNILVFLVP